MLLFFLFPTRPSAEGMCSVHGKRKRPLQFMLLVREARDAISSEEKGEACFSFLGERLRGPHKQIAACGSLQMTIRMAPSPQARKSGSAWLATRRFASSIPIGPLGEVSLLAKSGRRRGSERAPNETRRRVDDTRPRVGEN